MNMAYMGGTTRADAQHRMRRKGVKAVLVNRVYRTPQGVPEFSRGVPL